MLFLSRLIMCILTIQKSIIAATSNDSDLQYVQYVIYVDEFSLNLRLNYLFT